jgi:hypothetical protein
MTYNTAEVNEARKRLVEHSQEIRRTGSPHQQPLVNDIDTLLLAHSEAVEHIGGLESRLEIMRDNLAELHDRIEKATSLIGAASTEGPTLREYRDMDGRKPA